MSSPQVNHGESPQTPPYVIGRVESGEQVEYEKGGRVRDDGTRGVLNRPTYQEVPYTYNFIKTSSGNITETVEVGLDEYDRPSESIPEVINRIDEEYGWTELTDVGMILAYGTDSYVRDWPDTVDGADLIGIGDGKVSADARHGSTVGLYHNDGAVTPYIIRDDTTTNGTRPPENPTVVELSEGPIKQELTFEVSEYGSLGDLVRHIEEERRWYIVGYPQDIGPNEKVSAQDLQVAVEYEEHLRYPTYWVDSGGQKRRLH